MISLSTKDLTVDRISCWTSVSPAVWASRAMGCLLASCAALRFDRWLRGLERASWCAARRPPLVAALHPGRPALAGDHQRHLAGRLVDHLVTEHRGATLAA